MGGCSFLGKLAKAIKQINKLERNNSFLKCTISRNPFMFFISGKNKTVVIYHAMAKKSTKERGIEQTSVENQRFCGIL